MRGVKVNLFKATASVETDGSHHVEGVCDLFSDDLVLLSDCGIDDMSEAPVHWSVQISKSGVDGSSKIVERC